MNINSLGLKDSFGNFLPELGNGKRYSDYASIPMVIPAVISWDSWAWQIMEAINEDYSISYEFLNKRAEIITTRKTRYFIYHP